MKQVHWQCSMKARGLQHLRVIGILCLSFFATTALALAANPVGSGSYPVAPAVAAPSGVDPTSPPLNAPLQLGAAPTAVAPNGLAPPSSPLDVPLQLIAEAGQSYRSIRDYSCLFIKREVVNGQLQPENQMHMKMRPQPFSVYLRWLSPTCLAGQEVVYVAGRNNGMMRVHSRGILGAVGFVSIDPRDPRATQNNRHAITEAGIGNLIERYQQRWLLEKRLNKTQVRIADYDFAQRRCTRVETIHLDPSDARQIYCYRSVVYFDQETHLPIRSESYDWPRPGGAQEGNFLESYSYVNLRCNIGLGDEVFRH